MFLQESDLTVERTPYLKISKTKKKRNYDTIKNKKSKKKFFSEKFVFEINRNMAKDVGVTFVSTSFVPSIHLLTPTSSFILFR